MSEHVICGRRGECEDAECSHYVPHVDMGMCRIPCSHFDEGNSDCVPVAVQCGGGGDCIGESCVHFGPHEHTDDCNDWCDRQDVSGPCESVGEVEATPAFMVYTAGPFTSGSHAQTQRFIQASVDACAELTRMGVFPVSPHLLTSFYYLAEDKPLEFWVEGDLRLLAACDGCLFLPDWEKSKGACIEHKFCVDQDIPRFYDVDSVEVWVDAKRGGCSQQDL